MRVDSVRRARPSSAWLYTWGNVGVLRKGLCVWGGRDGGRRRGRTANDYATRVVIYAGRSCCRATMTLLFARPDPCSSHSVRVIRDVYASWMILLRYQWAARSLECELLLGSGSRRADAPPSAQLYVSEMRTGAFCMRSLTSSFLDHRAVCTLTFKSC